MSTVVLVSSWYTAGFVAAAVMIDRGRSAVIWWAAAAVLGGLAVGVALLATAGQRRAGPSAFVQHVPPAEGGAGVLAICRPGDRSEDLIRWLREAHPAGPPTVVCAVGLESFHRWVDTGEERASHRTFRRAAERLGPEVGTVLVGGRADAALAAGAIDGLCSDRVDAVVLDPDVLLPVDRPGGGRVLAERVAGLSERLGAPVVVVGPRVPGAQQAAVERSALA